MLATDVTNIQYFVQIVKEIRPHKNNQSEVANQHIQTLIHRLENNATALHEFRSQCQILIQQSSLQEIFSDNNDVFGSVNIFEQLAKDIKYRFLAPLVDSSSLNYKLSIIFSKKTDYIWVNSIRDEHWNRLFQLSGIDNQFAEAFIFKKIQNAAMMLSYKIAALGLDNEFLNRFAMEDELISPFLEQNKELVFYIDNYTTHTSELASLSNTNKQIVVLLQQCLESIQKIRKNTTSYGTSLRQTYLLNKTAVNIEHLKILLDIYDVADFNLQRLVCFFKNAVYNENNRYSIRHTLSKNIGHLAYQIAEHKGTVGEHYITSKKEEFFQHFKAAFGGGFIITLMVFLKVGASTFPITDFWKAILYSIIYASGFVLIHLLGFTVATKQPAMTASALAKELDKNKNGINNLQNIALLMAQVSRSQIIAIFGNLASVFPVTLFITWLLHSCFHFAVSDADHAMHYLKEIHPLYALSAWYAAIAGFYLFVSGIITGYFDNTVIYSRIPERIRQKTTWKKFLGEKRLAQLANYLQHNLGSIMGNIMIGFFLGTATFIGTTLGLPFDIRHITISTGLFAIALETLHFQIALNMLFGVLLGLFGIAFFNVISSFGFAFYVALKSRNIDSSELAQLPLILWQYFIKHPSDFIYPSKTERTVENVFGKAD